MNVKPRKLLAVFLGLTGIGLIVFVTAPILSYEIASRQKYPTIISPLTKNESLKGTLEKDYKDPETWFDKNINDEDSGSHEVEFYTLSIPKLKIKDARVYFGGEDLSKNLIQIPGTAVPGRVGNTVIFGHSVLPIFFNPENYLTIFSTLPRLEVGDEFSVKYDGITYSYIVKDMFEVMPSDIQILEQNTDSSYISLVTCVPPGHPLKPRRLVVRAKIQPV
ncbi:hypothetical protein A3A76_05105 [Candidatus Woesebacteria bacterium RIFCSPLOWO2_01_FULL_39_23]|uniref:Sortase n=2 Tax=Microgenomates group TaxID=1794810 RepID=A0A1F7YKK9_9BACT|nr:putative fimbrial associated sortase [uncultured Microgenomates bacterium Rifle_16ft_4_minimus_37633]OGM13860.1 MAG: hypothetical protein A2141_04330 [Candidatus Woesebacteria bacterium RBG_16_40_11]OGM27812.1 MAG: hypothetical protein A2628_05325 [Candidatus Woesebacteria bacterium RIFCSPHIGHO2_01_FULL_40_22]OGM36078.1 MAG: hypothetical protein A3E41_04570 [Candidatus Woesebacteria bacterium RIFCSPHIGHO2_12_FULL_38_9]OGM62234.1 MAG: hypothetical protein A3A76_05105 [Candidatus Woesebacteria